jgi:hypothetical protein
MVEKEGGGFTPCGKPAHERWTPALPDAGPIEHFCGEHGVASRVGMPEYYARYWRIENLTADE